MKTLAIRHGDLVLNGGHYQQVTGHQKLTQDLSHALREEVGVDRFHPRWGSLLARYVGLPVNQNTMLQITNEARRVVDNHSMVQRANINRDHVDGRKSRYGTGEIIKSVKGVTARGDYDTVHTRIVLTTLSAGEVVLITSTRAS